MGIETLKPLIIGRGKFEREIKIPIFQGAMGVGGDGAKLAAEVARRGGAGTIASGGLGFREEKYKEYSFQKADRLALKDELKKMEAVEGVWGVNVMVAATDYEGLVRVAVENGAKFIVSGAGPPLNLPALTADHPEIALIPIVSSAKGFRAICRKWQHDYGRLPDLVVIEDPRYAGGHLGIRPNKQGIYDFDDKDLKLENIIPQIREDFKNLKLDIPPIIAAGGVWYRSDIENRFNFEEVKGVQMATRFVTTEECSASSEFKQIYLNCKKEDIKIIRSPVGMLGRVIGTEFSDRAEKGEINDKCVVSCLHVCGLRDNEKTYCIIQSLADTRYGNLKTVFAGSNAPLSKEQGIVTVRYILDELAGKVV